MMVRVGARSSTTQAIEGPRDHDLAKNDEHDTAHIAHRDARRRRTIGQKAGLKLIFRGASQHLKPAMSI
jgi:hypothetical protein